MAIKRAHLVVATAITAFAGLSLIAAEKAWAPAAGCQGCKIKAAKIDDKTKLKSSDKPGPSDTAKIQKQYPAKLSSRH